MKYYTNTPTEQMLLNTAEGSNILNFDDLATALPDLGKQRVARAQGEDLENKQDEILQ